MIKIHDDFKGLDKKYSFEQREEVITYLYKEDKWTHCPVTKTWRKYVTEDNEEFANEEKIVFIKEPHHGSLEFVEWWYRVYAMSKDFLKEMNVFYHEPLVSMVENASHALLLACEVYYQSIENAVYNDRSFHSVSINYKEDL